MLFNHEIEFDPGEPEAAFARLPAAPAVFSLRGEAGEPYLNRTADLRRRLRKLLLPAPAQSRRLQLARLVRRIGWTETASEFGAQVLLYRAAAALFGAEAARRMHLRAPFFLRMGMRNRFPRAWVTNTLAPSAMADLFGPFPSRHAAERYAEEVLDLHLLRRCFQDLDPDPEFPGCLYSEMRKCLAPCFGGCSDERYTAEAAAVHAFLRTRGQSLLDTSAGEREAASERLDFEAAAAAHGRWQKVNAVARSAPELAGALAAQHAAIVQACSEPDEVELYLLKEGILAGPERFSMLAIQLPNESSGSTSLFAHPAAHRPVALGGEAGHEPTPEDRLTKALHSLENDRKPADKALLADHQALVARWYFRPQTKREGELIAAEAGRIPAKALLRACARVYRAQIDRNAVPALSAPGISVPG